MRLPTQLNQQDLFQPAKMLFPNGSAQFGPDWATLLNFSGQTVKSELVNVQLRRFEAGKMVDSDVLSRLIPRP
jgi:hypothetical protein